MWPGPFSPTAGPYGNLPLRPCPPRPGPGESQVVDRHLGMRCFCPLLDCCHNEDQEPCASYGTHVHSGSPASGYLYPWEPGDESWRDSTGAVEALLAFGAKNIRPGPGVISTS